MMCKTKRAFLVWFKRTGIHSMFEGNKIWNSIDLETRGLTHRSRSNQDTYQLRAHKGFSISSKLFVLNTHTNRKASAASHRADKQMRNLWNESASWISPKMYLFSISTTNSTLRANKPRIHLRSSARDDVISASTGGWRVGEVSKATRH